MSDETTTPTPAEASPPPAAPPVLDQYVPLPLSTAGSVALLRAAAEHGHLTYGEDGGPQINGVRLVLLDSSREQITAAQAKRDRRAAKRAALAAKKKGG